jgi:hypothetical protein
MEGSFPDEVTLALMDRFAEGKLSREELSDAIDRHVITLLAVMGRKPPADWPSRKRDAASGIS